MCSSDLADHGQGNVYELVYDGAGKDGGRFLPGLLDVEKLRAGMTTDLPRSGVNGEWSGVGRPPVGGWSAGGRASENAGSSSEKSGPDAQSRQNAHQDGEADHAAA